MKRRGVALTTTLMAMVVLFLVGATMVTLGSSNLSLAHSQANSERALYAAEAGLAAVMAEVATSSGDPVLTPALADGTLENNPTKDGWHAEIFKGPTTVPGTEVQVPTGYWYLLVTGTARSDSQTPRATSRVGALVTRSSGGNYQLGALIKDGFQLHGGRMVGWDPSDGGEVTGRDLFALLTDQPNKGRLVGAESEIDGKAFVQESTDPNVIMNYAGGAGPSDVTGGVTALPEALSMPNLAPPEGLSAYTDTTVDSAVSLPAGYYPRLTVTSGGTLSLMNGLYRIGELRVENGGQIHVAGGTGQLATNARLFVTETCQLDGTNAIVNSQHKPNTLWLHYFGEQALDLQGGSDAYFCVTAINAKVRLNLSPNGTFWGTITAQALDQDGGTFYYDTSLSATQPSTSVAGGHDDVRVGTTTLVTKATTTGQTQGADGGNADGGGTGTVDPDPNPGDPNPPVESGGGLVVVARQRL